jgi:hypothetical protein
MWAASAGGGVWRTADGGVTWTAVNDLLGNLACACIAMDPADPLKIYVGTGEAFAGDGIAGNGIFATTDGVTWKVLPATQRGEFTYVNRIAVMRSSGVTLAATLFGIFRSADPSSADPRQAMWTHVLRPDVPDGRLAVADVKVHPHDSERAVAGGFAGQAWYTIDGGLTWTAAAHEATWRGRVELCYAAKDPSVVYASVQMASGEIWRSVDGGVTYQPRRTRTPDGSAAPYLGAQGGYDNAIWAGDPTDADHVIVGGINLWRSTDGGGTLSEISTWQAHPNSPHADQHVIVAHPGYDGAGNRTVFFGNDGGVFTARDLNAVGREVEPPYTGGWTRLAQSLGITQFYGGAGNPTSGKIIGGTQDNGTLCFDPARGPGSWTTIFGGDGGWCAADPTDPRIFYGEYVYLNIHRNTDGGASDDENGDRYISGQYWNHDEGEWDWKPPPHRIPDAMARPGRRPRAMFIAPFVLDPNEPNRVLAGGLSLWRSNDAKTPNTISAGPSWQSIKAPIAEPDAEPELRKLLITALAVATGDPDTVWVGHADGTVFHTGDGTAESPTWRPLAMAPFPPRRLCTSITIDPTNKNIVYVAFGGFTRGNLWGTRNGGTTWSDLSATLPTAPVRAVAVHPRRTQFVYAGTEVGLFASEDSGQTWSPTNQGPTNCSVDDLFWMRESLISVTHGRGMFRIDLSSA